MRKPLGYSILMSISIIGRNQLQSVLLIRLCPPFQKKKINDFFEQLHKDRLFQTCTGVFFIPGEKLKKKQRQNTALVAKGEPIGLDWQLVGQISRSLWLPVGRLAK